MRKKVGLPDPQKFVGAYYPGGHRDHGFVKCTGVGLFVDREPAYAAFVFDGGLCEYCGKETEHMYFSYSLRIRLCGLVSRSKSRCFKKFSAKRLEFESPNLLAPFRNDVKLTFAWKAAPTLENSNALLYEETHEGRTKASRASIPSIIQERLCLEEESAKNDLRNHTQLQGSVLPDDDPRLTDSSYQRASTTIARTQVWMKFCNALISWQSTWQKRVNEVETSNKRIGLRFSTQLECKYAELIYHTSYGEFARQKTSDHEKISDEYLDRIRPTVIREIYEFREKQNGKIVTRLKRENIGQIWKYYQGLICHESDDKSIAYPSFQLFLSLPAIQFLRSPDLAEAKISVKKATSDSEGFVNDMVKHQLKKWTDQVKFDLLRKMDPSGAIVKEWKNRVLTSTTPPQICGRDVRWKCRVCDTVEARYAVDECLDFKGICQHQCKEKDGKKKRRGNASQPWSVDNFVRDEQASAVMASCLENLDAFRISDDKIAKSMISTLWICESCDPPLLVQSGSLIGHSHRHTGQMDIEMVTPITGLACYPAQPTFLGLAQWLILDSRRTKTDWVAMMNYSCLHCLTDQMEREILRSSEMLSGPTFSHMNMLNRKKMMREMSKFNFNGLRSHLASKHKVYKIRDEDFYCHQIVDEYPKALKVTFRRELSL